MRRYQGGISFGPEPTAAELAAAFGLSRTGPGNYNGPCPLCSGDDRFHVHEVDGRAVVGCRGCIDCLAETERRARYGEVMRLADQVFNLGRLEIFRQATFPRGF